MIFDGKNGGIVELLADVVVIRRKGILSAINQGLKGEKRIPYSSITSVQFKEPGMTTGYIQFGVLGGRESKGGVFDATQDENTVLFLKNAANEFRQLRDLVETRSMATKHGNSRPVAAAPSANFAEELTRLADLRDRGVLTEDEFSAQKDRLLGISQGAISPGLSPSAAANAVPPVSHFGLGAVSDTEKKMGLGSKIGLGCLGVFLFPVVLSVMGIGGKSQVSAESGYGWKLVGGLDDKSKFKFVELGESGRGGEVLNDAIAKICADGCAQVGFFVAGDRVPPSTSRKEFFDRGGWRDYKPAAVYFGNEFTKWDCKKAGTQNAPESARCAK